MTDGVDVVVTDGFTGNVVLKTLEGGMKTVVGALLAAFVADERYKPHADALLPALLPLYETLSPETYGGAMLLGVDGVCIIAPRLVERRARSLNGIDVAREMVEARHGRRDPRRHRRRAPEPPRVAASHRVGAASYDSRARACRDPRRTWPARARRDLRDRP